MVILKPGSLSRSHSLVHTYTHKNLQTQPTQSCQIKCANANFEAVNFIKTFLFLRANNDTKQRLVLIYVAFSLTVMNRNVAHKALPPEHNNTTSSDGSPQ